jgi:PEP-CTERM motif
MKTPLPPQTLSRAGRRLLPWLTAFGMTLGQAAPQLQAAAGAVGGLGNGNIATGCTTWGPPRLYLDFFGSGQGVSVPAGGIAACGYAGQLVDNVAGAGSAAASTSVGPVILGNPGFAGLYSGSGAAQAQFTGLRSAAQGSFSGGLPGGPTALFSASSAAFFTDALTLTSPLVAPASAGFVAYRFKLDGALTALGTPAPFNFGEARADMAFMHAHGPAFNAARVNVARGGIGMASSGGVAMPGWLGTTGQVSGSSIVSTLDFLSPFPIVFGQAWDFKLGLATTAYGEATASFLSTAQLVGLDVFDALGRPLADFTLTAASGTAYIGAVPEPAALALWLMGLGGVAFVLRARDG